MKKLRYVIALVLIFAASSSAWAAPAPTPIEPSTTSWTMGEYVVDNSVTVAERVEVTGEVVLILNDGCVLSADKGICVEDGNSLTIKTPDGSEGTGSLVATGTGDYSGIGGGGGYGPAHAGVITINGGRITAVGGRNVIGGAGIGGGGGSRGDGNGGVITITGGTVDATGGLNAAGIGCSAGSDNGNITITGGLVKARGVEGAGIGAGYGGVCKTVTISGGVVIATSEFGVGIGASDRNVAGKLKSEPDGCAWIVASSVYSDTSGFVSGVLFNGAEGFARSSPTVLTDMEGTVPEGSTLTVSADSTLTNNGLLTVEGTIDPVGYIVNDGTIVLKDMAALRALTSGGRVSGSGVIAVLDRTYFHNDGSPVATTDHTADEKTIEKFVVNGAGLDVKNSAVTRESALGAIAASGIVLYGSADEASTTPLKIVDVNVADGDKFAVLTFEGISGSALVSGDRTIGVDELNIIKIIGSGKARRLTRAADGAADGTYAILSNGAPVQNVRSAEENYTLNVFVADDGECDLAKGEKDRVVDPLVLVKSTGSKPHDDPDPPSAGGGSGGSCDAGAGMFAIVALAAMAAAIKRRGR